MIRILVLVAFLIIITTLPANAQEGVQIFQIIKGEMPGNYIVFVNLCAGDKIITPDLQLETDTQSLLIHPLINIAPKSCESYDFTAKAKNPDSILVTMLGQSASFVMQKTPNHNPLWVENVKTWQKQGLISYQDVDNCIAYLERMGIWIPQ